MDSNQTVLDGKVIVRRLPVVSPPPAPEAPMLKRLPLAQGELAHFYDGDEGMRYLAYVELKTGAVRGNHYHQVKEEWMYVIAGEAHLVVEDIQSRHRAEVALQAGDLVYIPTLIAHALRTTAAGHAIEFSGARFNPADLHRYPLLDKDRRS